MGKKNENKSVETMRAGWMKMLLCISTAFCGFMYGGFYTYAADLGQKSANWLLDQIFWIGIVVVIVALVSCFMKKAWVQGIIILVVGAVILFFVKNPETLSAVGAEIGNIIFGE